MTEQPKYQEATPEDVQTSGAYVETEKGERVPTEREIRVWSARYGIILRPMRVQTNK